MVVRMLLRNNPNIRSFLNPMVTYVDSNDPLETSIYRSESIYFYIGGNILKRGSDGYSSLVTIWNFTKFYESQLV